jgi:hypothetical protein
MTSGGSMEIILQGQHDSNDALKSLESVMDLFKKRYHISAFREIHLSVTLVDSAGEEVELVDSHSKQVYRAFEVYRHGYELQGRQGIPLLQLVIDNTGNKR